MCHPKTTDSANNKLTENETNINSHIIIWTFFL